MNWLATHGKLFASGGQSLRCRYSMAASPELLPAQARVVICGEKKTELALM